MPPRLRKAVRALLLTPDHRVLLIEMQEPVTRNRFWITPGGALEPGETDEDALRRELLEELGVTDLVIGPPIWTRSHSFVWDGEALRQDETFYLVETGEFEPHLDGNPAVSEFDAIRDIRWMTHDDIRSSAATFAPRRLPDLLDDLVENGPPARPIDAGV